MTTDHVPKMAAYAWHEGEHRYVVGGIAKGSGMISPAMATMLSFVVTDAPMSRAGLQDALREAVRRQLQHDLGRRRHVDQRLVLRVRPARNRRRDAGLPRRAGGGVPRSRGRDGARRRRRDQNAGLQRHRRERRSASAHDRARGDQQLAREDRALRRGSELGARHRRRRRGARRTRSGKVVAQARRPAVGRTRRDRSAERSRSAPAARRADDRDHARPRHRRRARAPAGAATSQPITCASTRTTEPEDRS